MFRTQLNKREEVVDYLSIICPYFDYKHLPREDVVESRIIQNSIKIILDRTKQHLMVFTPDDPVFCNEYLCSCNLCLQFKFKECLELNIPLYSDITCDDDFGNFNDDDNEFDRTEQIFNFVDAPLLMLQWCLTLLNSPLYFLKVTEKGTTSENHSDLYDNVISAGAKFLKRFYQS